MHQHSNYRGPRRRKKKGTEKIFEEIIVENSPNMGKEIVNQVQEEDITIVNIYVPNIGAPQYIRQMLTAIKGEINSNTIIVGDFNTPQSPMDR